MSVFVVGLVVWCSLAGLVCAFVAGAARQRGDARADVPLPVWLETFDERGPVTAPAPTATTAPPATTAPVVRADSTAVGI